MVEVKVYGLALDEKNHTPVLVLKDDVTSRTLPIWIGGMEAMAISLIINEIEMPRPMLHDLLLAVVTSLEGTVEDVAITRMEGGTYFAEIRIRTATDLKTIDSRPSDAVALALRARCPIFVARDILEKTLFTIEGEPVPVLTTEEAEQWNELLAEFNDYTKYTM